MARAIQTLIFSKKESPSDVNNGSGWTASEAKQWADAYGFRSDQVDVSGTEDRICLRQFDSDGGDANDFTEGFPKGVFATSCEATENSESAMLERSWLQGKGDVVMASFLRHGVMCVPMATQDIDVEDRDQQVVRHVISSGIRSHTGLEIRQDGWNFEHYHGQVLWDHDASRPGVGKNMDLKLRGAKKSAKLHAITKFAPTDFGRELFMLYSDGYMRDWSVGIYIDQSDLIEEKDKDGNTRIVGLVSFKHRLLEYSATPIGANWEAVNEALSKGVVRPETVALMNLRPTITAPASQSAPLSSKSLPDSLVAEVMRLEAQQTRLLARLARRPRL